MTLPLAPLTRILKKVGAKRVSEEAVKELSEIVEDKLFEIAKQSALLAKHAGRKTVIEEDVRMAKRKVLGR